MQYWTCVLRRPFILHATKARVRLQVLVTEVAFFRNDYEYLHIGLYPFRLIPFRLFPFHLTKGAGVPFRLIFLMQIMVHLLFEYPKDL